MTLFSLDAGDVTGSGSFVLSVHPAIKRKEKRVINAKMDKMVDRLHRSGDRVTAMERPRCRKEMEK